MHLIRISAVACFALALTGAVMAQDLSAAPGKDIDVDILLNYYEQDGDNSPVTGGVGTEELDVISPVVLLRWPMSDRWTFSAQLGVDGITSASTDNMDLGEPQVSGASRQDTRAYTSITATRTVAGQDVGFTFGLSNEYDYQSVQAGLSWAKSFRQEHTTVDARINHFADTIDLYGIDGINRGEDDRTTTDLLLALTQILSPRTVGSVEIYLSNQSGFLSTPFHEVILVDGEHVQERLPDSRTRTAIAFRLNHAFSKRYVQRFYYRYYDDDWGIAASTIELEPRFRLNTEKEMWIYPILRYHTQSGSDHFGLPATFNSTDEFYTADRELSEFTSDKFGLGWSIEMPRRTKGWTRRIRSFETRITSYSRDDGLDALSASFALGLRF